MGSWTFLIEPMRDLLDDIGYNDKTVRYVGREAAASPATGSSKRHMAEQQAIVDTALTIPNAPRSTPSRAPAKKKKATAKPAARKTATKAKTRKKPARAKR